MRIRNLRTKRLLKNSPRPRSLRLQDAASLRVAAGSAVGVVAAPPRRFFQRRVVADASPAADLARNAAHGEFFNSLLMLSPLLCLISSIGANFAGLQGEGEDAFLQGRLDALASDPDFQAFGWETRRLEKGSPFVFFVAGQPKPEASDFQEIEDAFGPHLAQLARNWKDEWANPLRLSPRHDAPLVPIALLPHFESYKEIATKKLPDEDVVPPSFLHASGVAVSYHRGTAFESKLARRKAIVECAAERLLATHLSEKEFAALPAWLSLGGLAELSASRDWAQDLARSVASLRSMQVPAPNLEDLLQIGSISKMETKVSALSRAALAPPAEVERLYRECVQIEGRSVLSFFREGPGRSQRETFQDVMREEIRGRGGIGLWKGKFGARFAKLAEDWENFALPRSAPEAAKTPPPIPVRPEPSPIVERIPAATLPPPVPLDLTPDSLLDLRAQMIHLVRSQRFSEALQIFYDPKVKQSKVLFPHLESERLVLDGPVRFYDFFRESKQVGDKIPPGFGPTGRIVQVEEQRFEIREKYSRNWYPWHDLDLRAVAPEVYHALKHNGPHETLDFASSLLVCGQSAKARELIALAESRGDAPERTAWLKRLLPEFEQAESEAGMRSEIVKIASLEPAYMLSALRQLLADPAHRTSPALKRAAPFFQGALAPFLARQFEKKGLASLFHGKAKAEAGGEFSVLYTFETAEEMLDWTPGEHPHLARIYGAKGGSGSWKTQGSTLVARGPGAFFHKTPWSAEVSLTFLLTPFPSSDSNKISVFTWVSGIGDDGKGNLAFADSLHGIKRSYADGRLPANEKSVASLEAERSYQIRVARFGSRIFASADGKETGSIEERELASGRVFFYCPNAEGFFAIQRVSIQGRPDPSWIEEKKALWVVAELKSLLGGLAD